MTNTLQMPKAYEPAALEPEITRFWLDGGYFTPDPDAPAKAGRFSIVIPPPNVTGALHLGHAINNTLQDVLVRWKRMQGLSTLWIPGYDHAGIATQAVVERRLLKEEGKTRFELGREGLLDRIWAWKDEYAERITQQLQRMGCSCDWTRTRFTLDEQCARAVRHMFFNLFRDGNIYRGTRLVNWDTQLQTAVADDEVYHETIKGHFWHLRYPLHEPRPGDPPYVVVATTRPETMLGDVAVAVNPGDARYRSLIGRSVLLPLVDRVVPILADEWADPEKGSGCVKITPAHDFNDYEVGQRHNLPMINVLNADGTMARIVEPDGTVNEDATRKYSGKSSRDARKLVVADFEALGLLEKIEDLETDIGHSDRSKTPIEPFLSEQWFIRMDELAQLAIDAVTDGRVRFHPPRYARTYLDWLGEKRDWCISRQLWWGHRIPIWYCSDVSEEQIFAALGGRDDVAWRFDPQKNRWLICSRSDDLAPDAVPGTRLEQDPDVLDTWFSSQLWPHSTLGWPDRTPEMEAYYPTDVLITSRDIITLWVARMVLASLYNCGTIPFTDVHIHAKILDGQGRTMSKSLGNGVDPLDIIEKYGTDALRYTLASMSTETQDVRMPVKVETLPDGRTINTSEKFELGRNFANKLWNAARFAFMKIEGAELRRLRLGDLALEDQWILSELSRSAAAVNEALGSFQYARAVSLMRDFFWDSLCDWYLELVKVRLDENNQPDEARQVLACCLDQTLRLLHPVIPFITEGLWRALNQVAPHRGLPGLVPCPPTEAALVALYPPADGWPAVRNDGLVAAFARLQEVTRAVRDVRMRLGLAARQPLDVLVRTRAEDAPSMRETSHILRRLAGIGTLTVDPAAQRRANSATVVFPDLQVYVLDCIDDQRERSRITAELAEVDGMIAAKRKKLANEQFASRAPAEVVQAERERLAEMETRREMLHQSLCGLD